MSLPPAKVDGRDIPRLRPEERNTVDQFQALMLRLAAEGHLSAPDLMLMTTVVAGFEEGRSYYNVTFEAILLLASKLYGFHPEQNPPPECPGEDFEIVLDALEKLRKAGLTRRL